MSLNPLHDQKVWITMAATAVILIFFLYPYTPYKGIKLETTRGEAKEIAARFLSTEGFDIEGFSIEGYLRDNDLVNNHILRKFGNETFQEIMHSEEWPSFGWRIIFHQNVSPGEERTRYIVFLNHLGKVIGYSREIPDSLESGYVSKVEAEEIITDFIEANSIFNISEFELVNTKEETMPGRTDYYFRWEKEYDKLEGKLVINASVQGERAGSFIYNFETPEIIMSLDSSLALFGTISFIVIFFLTQFAIFIFLRKYHEGEVWITMGRNLFLLYFVVSLVGLINYWPELGREVNFGADLFTTKVVVFIITGLIVHVVLSILVFSTWSVGESYVRENDPDKIIGLDAFLKGKILTVNFGKSLFRGFAIAATVLTIYLIVSILLNKGNGNAFVSPLPVLDIYKHNIPGLYILTEAFLSSVLSSIVIAFFVINITYQRWKKKRLSILLSGIATLLCSVIVQTPPDINILYADLLIGFAAGCFFAYIYIKYDLLTLISLHLHLYAGYKILALIPGGDSWFNMNFYIVFAALLITPGIYIISLIRNEEFHTEKVGIPSHIKRITERERMKKELEIAAKVQLSLLPKEYPLIPGYQIAGISIPAKEAGGDYYDFVKLHKEKTGVAIGDVSGKGVGAAIYMTLTKGILQAHAEENASPSTVLGKVNKLLYKTIEKNTFVSMFYAILNTKNHSLTYSRAGHNPGIFCSGKSDETKLLMSSGIALGLEEGAIFDKTLSEVTINIDTGDIIVLYTDGFTEAMNKKREEFGEAHLMKIIKEYRRLHPGEMIETILKEVHKFTADFPQNDDMTMVIVKRMENENRLRE